MRIAIAAVLALITAGCATNAQHNADGQSPVAAAPQSERNVFCFVDGRTVSCDEWQRYAHDSIDRILILRGDAAAERFGPEAEEAVLVSLKSTGAAVSTVTRSDLIYYFIDGRTASRADFHKLPRDTIDSIEILQSWAALERYGPEAEAGVFCVTTKAAR